jgi:aquaporin Z
MATADQEIDAERAALLRRRHLIRFEEDTLRPRPLWIRLIIEFLGTFVLVTVAAGSGVINHYVGGGPISRTAAVIAPGAVVMALIYAWGPLSGLHINPAVTTAFAARGVFPAWWVVPYWVAQFAGAIGAALFLQAMFTHVAAGGNYPIATPGGGWRSLVMETVLTAILVSVILNTATGGRSIGHNAAIAVGSTVALLGLFASISGQAIPAPPRVPPRTVGPGWGGQRGPTGCRESPPARRTLKPWARSACPATSRYVAPLDPMPSRNSMCTSTCRFKDHQRYQNRDYQLVTPGNRLPAMRNRRAQFPSHGISAF